MGKLVDIITSSLPDVRDQAIEKICSGMTAAELLSECAELELFRKKSQNLYHKVRALFFLYIIHRFHLVFVPEAGTGAMVPFPVWEHILNRRFEEAIARLLEIQQSKGLNQGVSSALADAYRKLGFQTLTEQVRQSVRSTTGNSWMFQNRVPHILEGDYTPLSSVNIFVKDLGIVLDAARKLAFPLPLAAAAHQLYLATAAAGHGNEDDAAVVKFYAELTGLELPAKKP